VGEVRAMGTNSDYDGASSYQGSFIGGGDYSDVESSGNIIKISSKESDASYLLSRN
jgi:hypothetical protein